MTTVNTELMSTTGRRMYWSLRRELWENRSVIIAPFAIAAVGFFSFLLSTIGLPARRHAVLLLDAAQQRAHIVRPYDAFATLMLMTWIIIAAFYCLDAMHGERKDRSILFWKSMPVSDRMTVLAKAAVPLFFLPALVLAIILVMHAVMIVWTDSMLLMSGMGATTWSRVPLLQQSVIFAYAAGVLAAGHAPIYGYFLLISAWAKRAAILWAVLPVMAIASFERAFLNTTYIFSFVKYRVMGFVLDAFIFKRNGTVDGFDRLTPGRFLSTPGLWLGLIFFAACVAGAVRLRRNSEPI